MMNKILAALVLCLSCIVVPANADSTLRVRSELLMNDHLEPSQAFEDLLKVMEIDPSLDLISLITQTQADWLRTKERWEEGERFADKREEVLPLLDKLGCLQAVMPTEKKYDEAVILGSLVSGLRQRTQHMIDAWNNGVRFDKITYLVGDWTPDLQREIPALLDLSDEKYSFKADWEEPEEFPRTEYELAQCVYEQMNLPAGLENVPVEFINTPMTQTPSRFSKRPNTADTLAYWIKTRDKLSDSCLFFSSQPYVGYQDTIIRGIVPEDMLVETVGCKASEHLNMSVHMDNIARWLYAYGMNRQLQ